MFLLSLLNKRVNFSHKKNAKPNILKVVYILLLLQIMYSAIFGYIKIFDIK